MFFKGAIFQCTYNQDGVLIHSQLDIYYYVPQQIGFDSF